MKERKTINPLIKSSIIYVIATGIGQGMSFLGIVVFTRLMGQAEYGEYSTYYAFVSILTVLIGANLYYSLNNAYIEKKEEINEYRKSVLILSLIIMLSLTVIMLLVGNVITETFPFFLIIMASMHAYSFFLINYSVYSANMENDYAKKLWLLILPNTLQFLVSLVLVVTIPQMTYEARIVGSTIGVGLVAFIVFVEIAHLHGRCICKEHWKYALSISLPTIVMSLSYMMMQQCDKVMIRNICGAEDTAVYSVIYYIGYILVAVDQAIAPVRQSWIFRRLDSGKFSETKAVQKWYLLLICMIGIGIIMMGPEILFILVPKSYRRMEYIVPFVLSACMMVLYRFYVEIILFYKKNIVLSLSVLVCAAVNVGLNAWWIPLFGAIVACYTTVISYGLLFLMTWYISGSNIKGLYDNKFFMAFILIMGTTAFAFELTCNIWIIRYAILLFFFIITLLYIIKSKQEIRQFLTEKK